MSIEEGKVSFELKRPLVYSRNGRDVTTTSIELREPGMDHIKEYTKLKQMIGQSQMDMMSLVSSLDDSGEIIEEARKVAQAGNVVKSFEEESGKIEDGYRENVDLLSQTIMSCSRVDASVFLNTFAKMACKIGRTSICMIDGEQAMTTSLWELLKPDDALAMAFEWCGFFAIALDEAEENTSRQQQGSATQPKVV